MGLDLATLAGKTAVTQAEVFGEVIKVTYDPTAITIKSTSDPTVDFVTYFVTVVKDWDLTKAKRKVALTEKAVSDVPRIVLQEVLRAVMNDVLSGESGKASTAG